MASILSKMKPKRERGHNWSTKEKIILYETVKDYLHIVSDCRNAVEVRKKKNITWAWITKLITEMGVCVTETFKIKTQWKRMRISAKKNVHAYQNGVIVDGKMVVPSELDWKVYNAINSCAIKRRSKATVIENEQSSDIKHESPFDCVSESAPNTLSDEVYSIEDESMSSHSEISLGSQSSNVEFTNQDDRPAKNQDLQNLIESNTQTPTKLVRSNELDWNLYNTITNENSENCEIKHEPDNYIFDGIPTRLRIPDINPNTNASHHSSISIGTQTINNESTTNNENMGSQIPAKSATEHQDKMQVVQLKIEEAKLKEIEERIHQQRVIFELNKTLLQKQIENESVKKYKM